MRTSRHDAGILQAPATHDEPTAQAVPQAPQFRALLCRSTQVAPHLVNPGHSGEQAPAMHVASAAHAFPQAPQF